MRPQNCGVSVKVDEREGHDEKLTGWKERRKVRGKGVPAIGNERVGIT